MVEHPLSHHSFRHALVRLTCLAAVLLGAIAVLPGGTPQASAQPAGIPGIDISNYQHPNNVPIDWRAVASSGVRFAYVKASEGTWFRNAWYGTDVNGAAAAGIYRGAYHFARPRLPLSSGADDANFFADTIGDQHAPGVLPPVLDLESDGGLPPAELAQWTRVFLNQLQARTGREPIIYTGQWFFNARVAAPDLGRYKLWFAYYTPSPIPAATPSAWSSWLMWQWGGKGIPGINAGAVDADVFAGDMSALSALANAGTSPYGNLDAVTAGNGRVHVSGWAFDPDRSGDSIPVHVYVGSAGTAGGSGVPRPDVDQIFRISGDHGFDITVPAASGDQNVCVYAINADGTGGGNTLLGCRLVRAAGSPIGSLDDVSPAGPNAFRVRGWSADPDQPTGQVSGDITVDGATTGFTTSTSRPDIAAALPGYGSLHGFDVTIPVSSGTHSICAIARNLTMSGSSSALGCKQVSTPTGSPVGALDSVTRVDANTIRVSGWTTDRESADPIHVHVYDNGIAFLGLGVADLPRGDVAASLPGYGANHGYSLLIPLSGAHNVCSYGINAAGSPGENTTLGCKQVSA
jgi:GH25 family lysozyme M1 (1,4-beta-N-acetylmuramidase)